MIKENKSQDVYKLWEGMEKPFYKTNDLKEYEKESWGVMCVFNVTEPTLTVYEAEGKNSGKAVVIIPGGGYSLVAIYHEGHDLAKVLAKEGITAAVLKYRLPNPDFSALIYGVTNLSDTNRKWLEDDLYHRKMTEEEEKKNRLIDLVSEDTPAAFLVHAYDDEVCKVEESTLYAQKLFDHQVPVEMHLFPKGGHGFGIGRAEDGTDQWVNLFIKWLKLSSFNLQD